MFKYWVETMNKNSLSKLKLLDGTYSICKIFNDYDASQFEDVFSVMNEVDVTTIIYKKGNNKNENLLDVSHDWKVLRIEGLLDFSKTGILSSIITPLSESKISVLVVSTFDTDYVFVQKEKLNLAINALKSKGYEVI